MRMKMLPCLLVGGLQEGKLEVGICVYRQAYSLFLILDCFLNGIFELQNQFTNGAIMFIFMFESHGDVILTVRSDMIS